MTPAPDSPHSNTWRTHPWVLWLHHNRLDLPAWMMAESLRPMAWVAGQLAVVAQPVASGLGINGWQTLIDTLDDPTAYDALCAALHPDEESPA